MGVKKSQSTGWEGMYTTKMNKKHQKYLPVMSKIFKKAKYLMLENIKRKVDYMLYNSF